MSERKTHKFDNFKWLNTNKLVEEGKESDEETLIFQGKSIRIGIEEIYFVELFYEHYIRPFDIDFIRK